MKLEVNVSQIAKGDWIERSDGLVHEVVRTFKDKYSKTAYCVEFTSGPHMCLLPDELIEVYRD